MKYYLKYNYQLWLSKSIKLDLLLLHDAATKTIHSLNARQTSANVFKRGLKMETIFHYVFFTPRSLIQCIGLWLLWLGNVCFTHCALTRLIRLFLEICVLSSRLHNRWLIPKVCWTNWQLSGLSLIFLFLSFSVSVW